MIPSPSGEVDPMEADLHSRGSISAVHELEVAAYHNHDLPPPAAELLPLPASSSQASNKTVSLGTAISLPVDDLLARMSPNTPTEDVLLDLYLMLSKAGSPLYLFNDPEGCNSSSLRNSNQTNGAKAQCFFSSTHNSCTNCTQQVLGNAAVYIRQYPNNTKKPQQVIARMVV
jgi:hypothetical protein